MTITKRPKPQKTTTAPGQQAEAAITAFIAGAPDAAAQVAQQQAKPAKVMINVQMPADLLAKVDEAAAALSLTRSGYIKFVLTRSVQSET